MGYESTLVKVIHRYYWPTLKRDVRQWCQTCTACQRIKVPHRTRPVISGTMQQPEARPGQVWYIDLIGDYNPTDDGNRYSCNAVDAATRFKVYGALKHKSATEVAQFIADHIVSVFGVPRGIHTDQGDEFTNAVVAELLKLIGTKKTKTTPYRPQGNSVVERPNQQLTHMMRVHAAHHPRQWDRLLFAHAFAGNCAYQRSVQEQPFYPMFGRAPELPVDQIFGVAEPATTEELREQQLALQWAFEAARRRGEAVQEEADERNARLSDPQVYAVGDQVWVARKPDASLALSPKLQAPFDGPHQVVRVLGPACVDVKDADTGGVQRLHVGLLKPYTAQSRPEPLVVGDCVFLGRPLFDVHERGALPGSESTGSGLKRSASASGVGGTGAPRTLCTACVGSASWSRRQSGIHGGSWPTWAYLTYCKLSHVGYPQSRAESGAARTSRFCEQIACMCS